MSWGALQSKSPEHLSQVNGTYVYSSSLPTWSFQMNPSADLVKQPSILFANISLSVTATRSYRNTDSTVQ